MKTEDLQAWVARWRITGAALARIRDAETRSEDLALTIELLEDAFLAAIQSQPPAPTSGLVEQQRWFRLAAAAPPASRKEP